MFSDRHIGVAGADRAEMLAALGFENLDELMEAVMPDSIKSSPLSVSSDSALDVPLTEPEVAAELSRIAGKNVQRRWMIGQGFYDTHVPAVVQRNLLENPSWYTAYTPYQPEISQGRLEALLNFQTVVADLTGLEVAGASLLDEGSAAAEAIMLAVRASRGRTKVAVDSDIFDKTREVVETRARVLGIELVYVDVRESLNLEGCAALVLQYPGASGKLLTPQRYEELADAIHEQGGSYVVLADLLACALLRAPGEFGADIAAGTAQRLGQFLSGGGPHAGYIATTKKYERQIPGRLVGVSKDSAGNPAYRLALQTREQHIRREKATSNICTAQALLAIMASMYAVYHGPEGLRRIAQQTHDKAVELAEGLKDSAVTLPEDPFFDTLEVRIAQADQVADALLGKGIAVWVQDESTLRISCDEVTTPQDIATVIECIRSHAGAGAAGDPASLDEKHRRTSEFLTHEVFHAHRTETSMMRYMRELSAKDYALDRGMIPLGSCTMKLTAAVEAASISLPGFAKVHPFARSSDLAGNEELVSGVEKWLAEITGYDAVSVQPNAGSQGEFAGLLAIRGYHESRGEGERTVCLIPASAHGTNAASAALAGFSVAVVASEQDGSISLEALHKAIAANEGKIAAIMLTYPSTHGTYEAGVREVINAVHEAGGQVYIDGANLNALVGHVRPGDLGGDVSHLNLHKTFAIPHGGGGPGIGPVCVKEHLSAFLPEKSGAVASAPWGSVGVLPITWAYLRLMGREGLREATAAAVMSANYVANTLESVIPVLYRGPGGYVGHECILDTRVLKDKGVSVDDVAKRLIDYGFHAPTMSFPVAGTLMVEPTESENKAELDRFCNAIIGIVEEAQRLADGQWPADDNPLVNSPHTAESLVVSEWNHPYSREEAVYPGVIQAKRNGEDAVHIRRAVETKYWPPVGRIDGPWGDRNFACTCPPPEAFEV